MKEKSPAKDSGASSTGAAVALVMVAVVLAAKEAVQGYLYLVSFAASAPGAIGFL